MPTTVIHHIDIRVKYLFNILHEILVLLLKFVIKNYNGQIDKTDFGKGLSEILGDKQFQKLKNSLSKDGIFKVHFFQLNPQPNMLQLKPSIEIDSLDISILTNLLNNIISNSNLKCCSKCSHKKCSCGLVTTDCPNKANCDLHKCVSCSKPLPCNLMIILKFCNIIRSLRNCFAHPSKDVYDNLEKGQGVLQDFPLTKTWEELWNLINNEVIGCLELILKNDPQLIPIELYENFQLDTKIAYIKDVGYILPILAETKNLKDISTLCGVVQKLDGGLIYSKFKIWFYFKIS